MAARTANVWGWSYIITFLAVFGAPDTPPGPLRQCVLDVSILFTVIGIMELVWRHQLVKTGKARWIKILALNEVGGTLALFWNLWLIYHIPLPTFVAYFKSDVSPQIMGMIKNFGQALGQPNMLNDNLIGQSCKSALWMVVFLIGPIVFLSQAWVIYRYMTFYFAALNAPPPSAVPPILKK
jgi:hypothetical protein